MTQVKKIVKYPSTEQFRNIVKTINERSAFVGLDESGKAMYDPSIKKPVLKFKGTVKIHGCFDANTQVTLANGEETSISELKKGDVVLSYDIDKNEQVEKIITEIFSDELEKDWVRLDFDNGAYLECTEDHKIYTTNRGWVEAVALTLIGQSLVTT